MMSCSHFYPPDTQSCCWAAKHPWERHLGYPARGKFPLELSPAWISRWDPLGQGFNPRKGGNRNSEGLGRLGIAPRKRRGMAGTPSHPRGTQEGRTGLHLPHTQQIPAGSQPRASCSPQDKGFPCTDFPFISSGQIEECSKKLCLPRKSLNILVAFN